MLKILYKYGNASNLLKLDPTQDLAVTSTYIQSFKSGKGAYLGSDGYAALCDDTDRAHGIIINDASGNEWENRPAIASLTLPVLAGGALIQTDQVVDSDVAINDPLYFAHSPNLGMWTSTKPETDSRIAGYAMSANTSSDKTVTIEVCQVS